MTTSSKSWHEPGQYLPLTLVLILALTGLTVISIVRPSSVPGFHSPVLDVALTVATMLIALGSAYFAYSEFVIHGRLPGLLLGVAFSLFASTDLGMGLLPVLNGRSTTVWLAYGWAVDVTVVGALFAAAGMLAERVLRSDGRGRIVLFSLIAVVAFSGLTSIAADWRGGTAPGRSGQFVLQVVAAALFLQAAIKFHRASSTVNRVWYNWLAICVIAAGFAQVQYAVYPYRVGWVQTGDVLRLLYFSGLLLGLTFEWSGQYQKLQAQAEELEALDALIRTPVDEDMSGVRRHIDMVASDALESSVYLLLNGQERARDSLMTDVLRLQSAIPVGQGTGDVIAAYDRGDSPRAALAVPLDSSGRRLGTLVAIRPESTGFTGEDVRLLRVFAAQASLVLERSLLYEEAAAGAVLQERSRLAREIHDGLAQHLAFLKMRVAWLQRSPTVEASALADIGSVLETALVEARHAISTLRAQPNTASLADAIEGYAQEFARVAGFQVACACDSVPDLAPRIRVEVLRIVQEALNNVRKHAHAERVDIKLKCTPEDLVVTVSDDGQGFQIGQDLEGHYGLEIMRERAESLRGSFSIVSAVGTGTQICVSVPLVSSDDATLHGLS